MLTVSSAAMKCSGRSWCGPACDSCSTSRIDTSRSAHTSATEAARSPDVTRAVARECPRMWPASSARYCGFTGTIAAPSRARASQVSGNSARFSSITATRSPAVTVSASAAARSTVRLATSAKVSDSPGSNVHAGAVGPEAGRAVDGGDQILHVGPTARLIHRTCPGTPSAAVCASPVAIVASAASTSCSKAASTVESTPSVQQ
jgi:hypothetical protein